MADSPAAPPSLTRAADHAAHPTLAQAFRELAAAGLWSGLGGFLYAAGLHEPVRPLLLWGGALPIMWGMTRGVIGLWHLLSVSRRGS